MSDIETALNNLDAGKYEPSMAGHRDRQVDVELVRETLAGLRRKVNEQAEDIRDLLELRKERDALRAELDAANRRAEYWKAELDALKAWKEGVEKQEQVAIVWRNDNGHLHGSCNIDLQPSSPLYLRPVPPAPSVPNDFLRSVINLCSCSGSSPEEIEYWDEDDRWIADLWRDAEAMLAAAPKPEGE